MRLFLNCGKGRKRREFWKRASAHECGNTFFTRGVRISFGAKESRYENVVGIQGIGKHSMHISSLRRQGKVRFAAK